MRQLASIQKIINIEAIEDADSIVKATILGWQLVIKKNEFEIGDLCVYVEIDSILPDKPEFEFLKNRNFRIRTIKLRGQVSQGICFPLHFLPSNIAIIEGLDVTETLEITKYEPKIPACLSGIMKGNFPGFIPKTDETRVQNLQKTLYKHQGQSCYITEKLDGTSATYFVNNGEFGVCSRNMELEKDAENTYWIVAETLGIETKLKALNTNVAIQAELVGEGIQSNKLAIKGQTIYIFNLFYINENRFAKYNEMKAIVNDSMQLNIVPLIASHYNLETTIETIVDMAKIKSTINPKAEAEGIVIRLNDSEDHVSFKAINNNFLLKYDD